MAKWPASARIAQVTDSVRRQILARDGQRAVNDALVYALQAAASHRRRIAVQQGWGDADLADAELAARILVLAGTWHLYRPERPGDQPLARFDAILTAPPPAPAAAAAAAAAAGKTRS